MPPQSLTISNSAVNDGFSETLNGSFGGTTGGVTTNGGSFTLLAPGGSNSSALAVGISTTSAGAKSGTALINLTSDGTGSSGLGTTALAGQTVNVVSGAVYRLAQPSLPTGTTIDFNIVHVSETVQQQVTVNNAAPADGFSEALDGGFSGTTGDVTASGSFVGLIAGASSTAPTVILNTMSAGAKSGTATLALTSDGAGTSNLASTALPSQVLTATGQVNNFASAQLLLDGGTATLTGSGTAYTLDFGARTNYQVSPQAKLRLRNAAVAPADTLAGSFSPNAPHFNLSGFKTFTGINAGQDFTPLLVRPTDAVGEFSETVTFNGRSQNGSGFDGLLAPVTITLHEIVANAPALRITPSGANLVVTWPVAEKGWVLRRSTDLQTWTDVSESTVDTVAEHTMTVARGADTKLFFRLEK